MYFMFKWHAHYMTYDNMFFPSLYLGVCLYLFVSTTLPAIIGDLTFNWLPVFSLGNAVYELLLLYWVGPPDMFAAPSGWYKCLCIILNGTCIIKYIAVSTRTHRCFQVIHGWNIKFYNFNGQQSLYSHQNTLCERGRLLIDHLIINLLTPPPPLPVLLIYSSPRTGVRLVSSHILACHLVSPAWHRRGGSYPLIFIFH